MFHCRVAVEDGAEHDSLFFLCRKPMYNAIVAPFYTLLPQGGFAQQMEPKIIKYFGH